MFVYLDNEVWISVGYNINSISYFLKHIVIEEQEQEIFPSNDILNVPINKRR